MPEAGATGRKTLLSPRQWFALIGALLFFNLLVPILNAAVPEESAFHVPDHTVQQLGKFMCYAILALGLDLIWGYCGILSLGHGAFFAFGAYCMGMNLMLHIGKEGQYAQDLPDFMVFLNWDSLPWYWPPFRNFWFAAAAAILVPTLFATAFGYLAFRSRIRGVYFAIITQAMTFALWLLFFLNEFGVGGNNGLTDFKRVVIPGMSGGDGFDMKASSTKLGIYVVTAFALGGAFLLCRWITRTKLGSVLQAIRDSENRVRFSGYAPVGYKLFVFVVSAGLAGLGGALYITQAGIINPEEMHPVKSIEVALWVAVGGRGTLVGALIGALSVNGIKSYLTSVDPDAWLFVLGGLFVVIVMVSPEGVTSIPGRLRRVVRQWMEGTHRREYRLGAILCTGVGCLLTFLGSDLYDACGKYGILVVVGIIGAIVGLTRLVDSRFYPAAWGLLAAGNLAWAPYMLDRLAGSGIGIGGGILLGLLAAGFVATAVLAAKSGYTGAWARWGPVAAVYIPMVIAGAVAVVGSMHLAGLVLAAGMFVGGCGYFAKSRGVSGTWGYVGLLNVLGVVWLFVLGSRSAEPAPAAGSAE